MSRTKHIVVLVGLVVIALLLHVTLCDYHRQAGQGGSIFTVQHGTYQPSIGGRVRAPARDGYTGLFAAPQVNTAIGGIFGVVLPAGLILLGVYLALHWRQQRFVLLGHCRECAHQMNGAARCPECGMPNPQATISRSAQSNVAGASSHAPALDMTVAQSATLSNGREKPRDSRSPQTRNLRSPGTMDAPRQA